MAESQPTSTTTTPVTMGGGSSRKRRNPYTSIACEECKRRKIKCTGESPCRGCKGNRIECVYVQNSRSRPRLSHKDDVQASDHGGRATDAEQSSEASGSHPTTTGRDVLMRKGDAQDTYQPSESGGMSATGQGSSRPEAQGARINARNPKPVTSELYLQMAESALADLTRDTSSISSGRGSPSADDSGAGDVPQTRSDKLAELGSENLQQIVNIYDEEVNMSYPYLDLQPLRNYIAEEYGQARTGGHPQVPPPATPTESKFRYEELLTTVIAIVMVLKGGGHTELGTRRMEEIAMAVRHRTASEDVSVHDIQLLQQLALFYFHSDREVLAWRTTGMVVRLLQELGFHRTESLKERFPNRNDLRWGVRLFWSVYSLERRFSFGSGLPFALQDADIDHDLPEPDDTSFPSMYVKNMISYTRIASEIWRSAPESANSPASAADETRDRLDFRVLQWRKNIPPELQFKGVEEQFDPQKHVRGHWRLRLLLYLRANQMRIVIHRNAMLRTQKRGLNTSTINTLIEISQDTIRVLARMVETSDLYEIQQQTYNFFLESALASLLIIVVNNKSLYDHVCGQDIRLAMDVIQRFAANSKISKRLWDKLEKFRNIERRIRGVSTRKTRHSNKEAQRLSGGPRRPASDSAVTPGGPSNGPHNGSVSSSPQQMDMGPQTTASGPSPQMYNGGITPWMQGEPQQSQQQQQVPPPTSSFPMSAGPVAGPADGGFQNFDMSGLNQSYSPADIMSTPQMNGGELGIDDSWFSQFPDFGDLVDPYQQNSNLFFF